MKNFVTSKKDPKIKVSSILTEYLLPNKVYLTVSKEDQLLIKNKKINKGASLYEHKNKIVYSPISGNITKIVKRIDYKGEEKTYLEILNDFKEEDLYVGSEGTTTIMVHDVKKLLEKNKIIQSFHLENKKILLLNTIEDEPYVANNYFLFKNHKDEILLFLDTLASIYQITNIKLAVKEQESEIIEILEQVLETYPNIELQILPDIFLLQNDFFLKKYLKLKEEAYLFYPDEILELYFDIVKMRKKDFIYITLTGDAIKNPQVVKVKKGTELKELLSLIKIEEEYDIIVNHLLHHKKRSLDKIILSEEISVIYFMKKETKERKPCIHCGKCNFICPISCKPYQSVITNGKYKNKDCLSCGLCTFICPSNIDMESYLKKEE